MKLDGDKKKSHQSDDRLYEDDRTHIRRNRHVRRRRTRDASLLRCRGCTGGASLLRCRRSDDGARRIDDHGACVGRR